MRKKTPAQLNRELRQKRINLGLIEFRFWAEKKYETKIREFIERYKK